MSPDRHLGRGDDDGSDMDEYGEAPRSIFSALWFRALLAVLILGVLAAVAVPYVLDVATTPTAKTPAKPASMAQPTPATPPAAAASAAPVATDSPAAAASTPVVSSPASTGSSAVPAIASPAPAPETAKPKLAPAAVAKPPVKAAKAADTPNQAPKASATKANPSKAATVAATGGSYWVQVGAFKEPETAKRLVARLREQGLQAEASTTSTVAPRSPAEPPSGGSSIDRYDVVVSGASASDVDAKLAAKGLTGETTPNGIVVRPSLALREAVALSRDLADAGLRVQVRRVGGSAPVAATPPPSAVMLHRVRVGGFPDRATAVAAAKQLEEKGFKPFIGRGNE
jgi:cell division septation protein DedD